MGTRKNAKFLSASEKENYVKACVLMKADIVNPGAPAASQYSKWEEFVAIHLVIQAGFAPGMSGPEPVNFAHGGTGAFAFLSWHRQFLAQFEQQLQTYVPGVMIPYWDWTDPAAIMTDNFMGPNGNPGNSNHVERGYFAFDKPGVGLNTTALPAWWPASLNGWRLPTMFQSNLQGALRRNLGSPANLPLPLHIETTMSKPDYASFQEALETGSRMHNALHGWLGGNETCASSTTVGHMTCNRQSPFDPLFFLHHCNVDRLWAMWQADGHANEYPNSGGKPHHLRTDPMYPWIGATPGYGNNAGFSIPIPAFPLKRNVDTLDYRANYGYCYDTIPIIGIALDRTGSMLGMTPDPMVTAAPDVTKWEAAKRGVSAFLQDCQTVQASRTVYVIAGVKTFRSLPANDFTAVFGAPGYGLIKTGTSFSKATFDANAAPMTPAGGTPLADALLDVQNTLVDAPYAGAPANEQRYLAMLTDGIRTSGAAFTTIPDHSLTRTGIFAMGFGTGLDVDYTTLATMVAKGKTLSTTQIFHGENVGTIDKFFSNSLAAAIGFTSVFDPVIELFEGEHTHLSFTATSADDAFFITAQGMDFIDKNWSYVLHGPNGQVLYGDGAGHDHSDGGCNHCCPSPYVTAARADARASIVVQRGGAGLDCWVGNWVLMIMYKTRSLDAMFMPELGEILFPVSAGPIKGSRYSRLLTRPPLRKATRNVISPMLHGLDLMAASTNNNDKPACNVLINIYARTNLKVGISLETPVIKKGEELKFTIKDDISVGSVKYFGGFARLISPSFNMYDVISKEEALKLTMEGEKTKRWSSKFDLALLLARYEKEKEKERFGFINDNEVKVVSHEGSSLHIHHKETAVRGVYHLGLIVDGLYYPGTNMNKDDGGHDHGGMNMSPAKKMAATEDKTGNAYFEKFTRILTVTVGVEDEIKAD